MATTTLLDCSKITDPQEFMRYSSQVINDMQRLVNGNILLNKSNMLIDIQEIDFDVIDSNVAISHNFKKTGVNFIVVNKDATCDIYHSSNSDDKNTINLSSTVGGVTVTLLLF